MKLTVTYEVSGDGTPNTRLEWKNLLYHLEVGPLSTGLDAANAQLEAEDKKLRLKLIDIEVE